MTRTGEEQMTRTLTVDVDICLSLHQLGRVVGEAVDKAITSQTTIS